MRGNITSVELLLQWNHHPSGNTTLMEISLQWKYHPSGNITPVVTPLQWKYHPSGNTTPMSFLCSSMCTILQSLFFVPQSVQYYKVFSLFHNHLLANCADDTNQ